MYFAVFRHSNGTECILNLHLLLGTFQGLIWIPAAQDNTDIGNSAG